jgi:hypothetical protein
MKELAVRKATKTLSLSGIVLGFLLSLSVLATWGLNIELKLKLFCNSFCVILQKQIFVKWLLLRLVHSHK